MAVTLEVPPTPPLGSSVTVYDFPVHLAYKVVLSVLFHVLALPPFELKATVYVGISCVVAEAEGGGNDDTPATVPTTISIQLTEGEVKPALTDDNKYISVTASQLERIRIEGLNETVASYDWVKTGTTSGERYRLYFTGKTAGSTTVQLKLDGIARYIFRIENKSVKNVYNSRFGGDIYWTKVDGAIGYNVYCFSQIERTQKITTINNVNTLHCYDTRIQNRGYGCVYQYFVKALYKENGKTVEGPASERALLQRIAPMQITSATNNAAGTVSLKWKCTVNENKAYGYEIHYAESYNDLVNRTGTFKTATVNGRNNMSKWIKNLKKGKTYSIRLRSYVIYTNSVTGKQTNTWSQFSNIVNVKINK